MDSNLRKINESIFSLRDKIVNHPVYSVINELCDLRIFMQHHAFAAWDYMSLLVSVQKSLKLKGKSTQMIDQMIELENYDLSLSGEVKSHFELYIDSMRQSGADHSIIDTFSKLVHSGWSIEKASNEMDLPPSIVEFIQKTDKVNSNADLVVQIAVLVFCREDLIPSMFITMINELHERLPDQTSMLNHYLKKHVIVEGMDRKKFLFDLLTDLCGTNEIMWKKIEIEVIESLNKRLGLLDEAYETIINQKLNDYYGYEIDYSASLCAVATG